MNKATAIGRYWVKYAKIRGLTRIFPYKDRFGNSDHMRENTGQRKPIFLRILLSEIPWKNDSI